MVMLFNETKRATVAIVPKITGFLSLCGSTWIIVEVLTAKGKRKTVYNRLLLSMSIMDAAVSITYIASTWPIPRFSPTVVGAFGTVGTCTAQGFFNQLGIVSPIYNVCLGVYYVLVLKFGITEVSLRKNVEPIMHITAIGFGVATAVAAIPLTLFNNADLWCWIAPLPFDCDESYQGGDTCIRGDNAFIYRWAFFYGPLWFCMLMVILLSARVFLHVKRGEKEAIEKQEAHDKMHGRGSARDLLAGKLRGSRENQTSVRLNNPRHRRATSLLHKFQRPSMFSMDDFGSGDSADGATNHRRTLRMAIPENLLEKFKNRGFFAHQNSDESLHATNSKDNAENSIKTEDIQHVMDVVEDYPSAAKQYTAAYQFGSRIIVAQCIAYTVAFFLAWTPSSINRVVQHELDRNYFGLLLAQGIFEPLQGLFNVLVYRFGYYMRLRAAESHLSKWEVFKLTWTWSFIGGHRDAFERKSIASANNGIGISKRARSSARSSMSPAQRTSLQSKIAKGSDVKDSYISSTRGSAIEGSGLKVNILPDDAVATAHDHVHSLMGELMLDFTENPSMINQKMVVVQSDFPQFSMDDFYQEQEASTPSNFPVPLTSTGEQPVVAPMDDFPIMNNFPNMTRMTDDSDDGEDERDDNVSGFTTSSTVNKGATNVVARIPVDTGKRGRQQPAHRHCKSPWHLFYVTILLLLTPSPVSSSTETSLNKPVTNETTIARMTDDQIPMDDPHLLAGTTATSSHACTCHSSQRSSKIPNTCRNTHLHNSSDNCGARIFYLIGIHNQRTLDDALYLFRSIRDARNTILIHLDTKFGLDSYHNSSLAKEIEACPCGSHVEVASVHDCQWGSWSMMLPTLWSMEKAVTEYAGKWDVYINLSGDTLPVYTQDRVAELFAGPLKGINFVTSVVCETGLRPTPITAFPKKWHKRNHYSHQPPNNLEFVDDAGVKQKVNVTTYFGSQWMSLTPTWCEFIIRQLQRSDSLPSKFKDWLIQTQKLMADETFFSSMMMYFAPETLPNITDDFFLDRDDVDLFAIRYERMDEHVPSSSGWFPTEQRYDVPKSSGVEQPRPWGPYFLGVYDLANIRESGALFVRKVANVIDRNMYHILPVDEPEQIPHIGWPEEVEISDVPDWEATLAKYKTRALHKQQADKKGETKAEEDQESIESESSSSSDEEDMVEGKLAGAKEGL